MGSCACVHIDSIVVATLVCTLTLIIIATLVCTNSVRGRVAPERLLCFSEIPSLDSFSQSQISKNKPTQICSNFTNRAR
jgi:hypothetical protein